MKQFLIFILSMVTLVAHGMDKYELAFRLREVGLEHVWDQQSIEFPALLDPVAREMAHRAFEHDLRTHNTQTTTQNIEPFEQPLDHPNQNRIQPLEQDSITLDRDHQLDVQNTFHGGYRLGGPSSAVYSPERNARFLHRDSTIWPFISRPDMSRDHQIQSVKEHLKRHDAASLAYELRSAERDLQNTSFIDRYNRYMISRRLSFIAKHVQQDSVMNQLLLINNTSSLTHACNHLKGLSRLLERDALSVNGHMVRIDGHKRAEIMKIARRIMESRSDYRDERQKYPATAVGGKLLDQSPVLDEIDFVFAGINPVMGQSISMNSHTVDLTTALAERGTPELDTLIGSTLCELHRQYPDFGQYQQAAFTKLKKMHEQGLLIPAIDIRREVLFHGIQHYFKSLVPNNPLTHPKEFTINLIKYTALGAIHTATGGVLIPVQIAAQLASTVHHLQSVDTSQMTPNEYAEFIAEELADITYTVATTKSMNAAKNTSIPEGFIRVTRDVMKGNDPQVALAGGGSVPSSSSSSANVPENITTFAKSSEKVVVNGTAAQRVENLAKTTGAVSNISFSQQAIDKAIELALKDENTIGHIFDKPYHNLNPLVEKLGGVENTIRTVVKALADELPKFSRLKASGVYEEVMLTINGYNVYVTGRVVNDIPRIGTFYIK